MKVLVYGDLNLDLFFFLDLDVVELRDVSYVAQTSALVPGGSGGNLSVALSRLGQRPILVSTVGADPFGELILEDLTREKVEATSVRRVEGLVTGIMVVIIRKNGERTIIGYRGANAYNTLSDVESRDLTATSDYTFISGFTSRNVDGGKSVEYLIDNSVGLGLPVGIDLGGVTKRFLIEVLAKYRGAIYDVFINLDELRELFGPDTQNSLTSLISALKPKNLFLKIGSRGSLVYSGEKFAHIEAVRVSRVIDTTGCGDAYDAGAIYGLLMGLPSEQRAALGNLMGAYKAGGLGARHLPRDVNELKSLAETHLKLRI
ncbi:MAG: PfkB family carbohydrate kinase [Sulfolobales archaeon]